MWWIIFAIVDEILAELGAVKKPTIMPITRLTGYVPGRLLTH
jgi:hypothetical protein